VPVIRYGNATYSFEELNAVYGRRKDQRQRTVSYCPMYDIKHSLNLYERSFAHSKVLPTFDRRV